MSEVSRRETTRGEFGINPISAPDHLRKRWWYLDIMRLFAGLPYSTSDLEMNETRLPPWWDSLYMRRQAWGSSL